MELTPVESSNIAAIGYLEADRVLLVRYHDGSLYAHPGCSGAMYETLVRANSKGKWMRGMPGILIAKGGAAVNPIESKPEQRAEPHAVDGPLNVIDEDADKCCRKHLTHFFERGSPSHFAFDCEDCGTRFMPEVVGSNVYWRIVPQVSIVRPR